MIHYYYEQVVDTVALALAQGFSRTNHTDRSRDPLKGKNRKTEPHDVEGNLRNISFTRDIPDGPHLLKTSRRAYSVQAEWESFITAGYDGKWPSSFW